MSAITQQHHEVRQFMRDQWRRKYAADAGLDADQEEEAFCRIAFNEIQRKAGDLNTPEHRLGFELVYKNDDGNRMVGLFAFRAGETVLFIPAMFLNGEVKGTDLLYRTDTKTIVPVNDAWITYILEQGREGGTGRGIPRNEADKISPDLNLHLLATPQNQKRASERKAEYSKAWEAVKTAMARQLEVPKGLLRRFMSNEGEFAKRAFDRIIQELETNPVFAAGFDMCCDRRDLTPPPAAAVKTANTPPPPLVLHLGLGGIKQASETDLERNYWVEDNREKHATVSEPMHEDIEGAKPGCVYQVACKNGEYVKALVALEAPPHTSTESRSKSTESRKHVSEAEEVSRNETVYRLLDLDAGKFHDAQFGEPAGMYVGPAHDLESEERADALPEAGGIYVYYLKRAQSLSRPIYVDEIITRSDGMTMLLCHSNAGECQLVVNPDMETSRPHQKVLGAKDVCFLRIEGSWDPEYQEVHTSEWESTPMDQYEAVSLLTKQAAYKVRLIKHSRNSFLLDADPERVQDLTEMGARMYLMGSLGMKQSDSDRIVKEADERGETTFLLEPWVKESRRVLLPEPEWTEEWDGVHNVPIGEDRKYQIQTDYTNTTHEPTPHYGDAMTPQGSGNPPQNEPGVVNIKMMSMSPAQIEAMANAEGMSQVFEHGVIGSMVNSFDGVHVAERYVKDIEKAVDRIGRWLFLFYWKPEDFEKSYGSDKMQDMEDAMMSVFKSLGDITIDLKLQSTDSQNRGSPIG